MARQFTSSEFDAVLARLAGRYKIIGPVALAGRGRFSDTDLLRYGPVSRTEQIAWDRKTYLSPKQWILPATQRLFRFEGDAIVPVEAEVQQQILLCRPCDINAVDRLDRIFLHNGPAPDPFYQQLRQATIFFMIECVTPFDSCFCCAMGANRTDDWAVGLRFTPEGGILASVKDPRFAEFFGTTGTPVDFTPQFPQKDGAAVRLPLVEQMPEELFTHPLWEEYTRRCIGCGRCNTSCPTCSCFSVSDVRYEDHPASGERRRVWAGCHIDGFTDMAGGHSFRQKYGDRMRFKTFHKIYDYRKRFGVNQCVGCGRCDDVCPEYISFANCINKVTAALEQGGEP